MRIHEQVKPSILYLRSGLLLKCTTWIVIAFWWVNNMLNKLKELCLTECWKQQFGNNLKHIKIDSNDIYPTKQRMHKTVFFVIVCKSPRNTTDRQTIETDGQFFSVAWWLAAHAQRLHTKKERRSWQIKRHLRALLGTLFTPSLTWDKQILSVGSNEILCQWNPMFKISSWLLTHC